jgi:hypothetical protein
VNREYTFTSSSALGNLEENVWIWANILIVVVDQNSSPSWELRKP